MISFLYFSQLDSEAVQLYIEHLWSMFLYPSAVDDVDQYRRNLIDQVIPYQSSSPNMSSVQVMSLFRNHKLRQLNSEKWMVYFTKMVFQQVFFNVIKTPKKSSLQV